MKILIQGYLYQFQYCDIHNPFVLRLSKREPILLLQTNQIIANHQVKRE